MVFVLMAPAARNGVGAGRRLLIAVEAAAVVVEPHRVPVFKAISSKLGNHALLHSRVLALPLRSVAGQISTVHYKIVPVF
jgi:hypothetical protein